MTATESSVDVSGAHPVPRTPRLQPGRRFQLSRGLATMVAALAILVVLCFALAPSAVAVSSVLSMLPFAAVLAIVGLGQMLVVQQGGFDLSVPGAVSLAVVIVTAIPNGDDGKVPMAIGVALLVALAAGLLNGFLVGRLGLNAIIATLGVNALFYAGILGLSGGTPRGTAGSLIGFVGSSVLFLPMSVVIALVVLALVTVATKMTVPGRRFEAVGASNPAAAALGFPVQIHRGAAYIGAQVLYATAGIVLAGITLQPSAYLGENYLLPSVAVVVLAGTSLLGGRGFPVATAVAALFLTHLDQFTMALGAPYAARTLVQAVALAVGVAIYAVDWSRLPHRSAASRAAHDADADE